VRVGLDARLVARGLGISQFITNIARQMSEEVEIVWLGDPALSPHKPSGVVRADRLPYPALDGSVGRRRAHKAGVDLVHFTANTGWRKPAEMPFVLTVHDLLYTDSGLENRSLRQIVGHRYARWNVPAAVRAANAVASPSAAAAEEVTHRTGRSPVVIANGVDADLLELGRAGRTGRPDAAHERYAVAFAAHDPRKGVALAIKGWRAAAGAPPRLVLLAGGGLPAGVTQEIESDRTEGRIELERYLPRERLIEVLAGADALIYPSESEGFGLPVIEAMAVGVPVITGLNPAVQEVAGDASLAIDPSDRVASIAEWLRRLDRDPTLRARTVEAGLRRAEKFSWLATARAYETLYSEVLQSRRVGAS
jgi:glycosyltransferase involved in cell wall biosynthesis